MASKSVTSHGQLTCTVEISPSEVDAGMEMIVTTRVTCPHGCDLTGQFASIRDQDDVEVVRTQLNSMDEGTCVTNPCTLHAPRTMGNHTWRAVFVGVERSRISHEETSVTFTFTTLAHTAHVHAWGMPPAIAAGERFKFNVGIKCSAGCNLSGRPLSVVDHDGVHVGTAKLRDDIWPGTTALYCVKVEATAPATVGDFQWQVTTPQCDEGLHADGSCNIAIKAVRPPDHEVTVEAFDSATKMPIKGVNVMCRPYQSFTDGSGTAKVKVANGRYTLYVSGFNYIPHENIIDVVEDVLVRVELTVEPEEMEDYR